MKKYFLHCLSCDPKPCAMTVDATSAFPQSDIVRPTPETRVVAEPPEGEDDEHYWDLEKALPGMRVSSVSFQNFQVKNYQDIGFDRCPIEPQGFVLKEERNVKAVTHTGTTRISSGTRSSSRISGRR